MKRLLYVFFLIPLFTFSQAPTNTVRNISVNKFANKYLIIFDYQRGTGSNVAADSFVVQLHQLSSVCATTNCLPSNGEFFKRSASKQVNYSDFQVKTCGTNQLRCLKFRMKSTGLGASTKDSILIHCVDSIDLGVIIYTANGTAYKTNGYNCSNPSLEPKIWTAASPTIRIDSVPTAAITNLFISDVDSSFFTINWRNSFSDSVLILGFTDTATSVNFTAPTDGMDYGSNATNNYPLAPNSGPGGWKVYYAGRNTNPGGMQTLKIFNIPSTKLNRFFIRAIPYNKDLNGCIYGITNNNAYLNTNIPETSTKLKPAPPSDTVKNFRIISYDSSSIQLGFTIPTCDSFLLVYSSTAFPNFLPNGFYLANTDSSTIQINQFDTLRNDQFLVIYKGSGLSPLQKTLNITGFQPDQFAYFTLFTFNSNGEDFENYNTMPQKLRAFTDAIYPANCPIYQGSFSNITNVNGSNFFEYTISWDKGIGTSRTLVVLSQNGPITGSPNEKREYHASDRFGFGDQLAPGEYIVYNDTGRFILVSDIPRLGPSTPIYFKLFSFNGTKVFPSNPDSSNTYYNISCVRDSFLLPVTLKFIQAKRVEDLVVFEWETAQEIQNQGFQIQWSEHGKNWKNLDFIPGHGNSSISHSYRWSKSIFQFPTQFYLRFQQKDFNGNSSFSPVFSIIGEQNTAFWSFQNNEIWMNSPLSGTINYKIYDVSGRIMEEGNDLVRKKNLFQISTSRLPSGVYFVQAAIDQMILPSFKFFQNR